MKKLLLIITLTTLALSSGYGQNEIWSKSSKERISDKEKIAQMFTPSEFEVYSLNIEALKARLQTAPSKDNSQGVSNVIVSFPNAKGEMLNYRVYESSTMHSDLAAKYKDIKTYVGIGVEDPTASIGISTTIFGLHAFILSSKSSAQFIQPYTKDLSLYMVYNKNKTSIQRSFTCDVLEAEGSAPTPKFQLSAKATDSKLRTYRMAMACTQEYSTFHVNAAGLGAGTLAQKKAATLAAMVVTVNRLNQVYEKEMSLRFQLVPNNDAIIFIVGDPANLDDGFSNNTPNSLINESQTKIDAIIGSANYDIGHTVSTGGGGLAQRPSVCVVGKARGITGSPAPVGDPYDIDFVAHEVGHQFGGNHTFAGDAGNCSGNRSNTTAVEPGSGTTIMAYAGICSPQNVQPNSDPYFHTVSLDEMFAHITGAGNCVAGVASGNTPPTIPALTNYTIPSGTPFKLTAPTASDVNGDALTYCWEQSDGAFSATSTPLPSATALTSTNFRSFSPTTSLTRFIPNLTDLNSGSTPWEVLSTVARTYNFKLTVRDNNPSGGQTAKATATVSILTGLPFKVTSQNVDGITWSQNSAQTITWTVGGSAPATTNVNILLSTDGGLTYPTVLVSNTPNDGTESITVPNIAAPFCRIKVEPTNNIFYSINSKAFAIGYIVTNTCNTYTNSTPLVIPDATAGPVPGAVVFNDITVPVSYTLSDVNVSINLTHTYPNDLTIALNHPDATQNILWANACAGNDNFNITLSDGSPVFTCVANMTGTFAPSNVLSIFNGKSSGGTWTLLARDRDVPDAGQINSWSVEVCSLVATLSKQEYEFADFTLFPNPNNGEFTVKLSSDTSNDIKINIHDMRGRQVYEKSYANNGVFNQNVKLSNMQSGVYLVSISDGARKTVKRIVVE